MAGLVEKKIKSTRVHRGSAVDFYQDVVRLPDGRRAIRDYMKHPGAVTVVPFLNKKEILILRQHRYPVGKTILEIPAGKIDPNESPLTCAKRELLEETGYWPRKIKRIFSFWPTPAFATETMHIYMAWNLVYKEPDREEDEFLEPFPIKFSKVVDLIKTGKIQDAKSVIAILTIKTFNLNPYQ